MSKTIVLLMFFLITTNCISQINNYLFERGSNESATEFIERHFEGFCDLSHTVLEGYWGDESKGKKIVAFFDCPVKEQYSAGSVIVFQPVGDGKNYLPMSLDIEQTGRYKDEIVSVFYFDANNDGIKELFVLIKGAIRTPVTLEEEDEDGNVKEYQTTACCEDIYRTEIIEQPSYLQEGFLPVIDYFYLENECDFEGLKTADEVKIKMKTCLGKED
jgi:hypothetical protein